MTHVVPEHQRAAAERTLAATPGVRGEPSDAERSRTLIAAVRTGSLATIGEGGFPFGSLVSHALDPAGRPLLLLSDLAEHSRNLAADPRASLMATEVGAGDPLALARVTVIGRVGELLGDERAAALETYRAAQPGAFYAGFADFRLYRLDVESVRYVGGFGRMSWVDAAGYAEAEPDPLRPHAERIIAHMNDDHTEALVLFCRRFAERPDTTTARMVAVDRYGFAVLAADEPGGQETAVRLPFDERTDTPDAARKAMVELVRRARAA
ncbi:HugZ family pyridoxamine 5'-phosphate oxidase [Pseudonocardia sp. DLS-67]